MSRRALNAQRLSESSQWVDIHVIENERDKRAEKSQGSGAAMRAL